jgi:hypothetical protein
VYSVLEAVRPWENTIKGTCFYLNSAAICASFKTGIVTDILALRKPRGGLGGIFPEADLPKP